MDIGLPIQVERTVASRVAIGLGLYGYAWPSIHLAPFYHSHDGVPNFVIVCDNSCTGLQRQINPLYRLDIIAVWKEWGLGVWNLDIVQPVPRGLSANRGAKFDLASTTFK